MSLTGLAESYLGTGSHDYCRFNRLDAVEVLGRADPADRRHRTARACHGPAADRRRARGHRHRRATRTTTCIPTSTLSARRSATRCCSSWPTPPMWCSTSPRSRPAVPGSAGINGLVRVAHAAARAGARLIYVSVVGRPADAVPAGRDAGVQRLGAEPGRADSTAGGPPARLDDLPHCRQPAAQQGVRPNRCGCCTIDDLLRFLVLAVATDSTGVVDLASPDTTDLAAGTAIAAICRSAPAAGPPAELARS